MVVSRAVAHRRLLPFVDQIDSGLLFGKRSTVVVVGSSSRVASKAYRAVARAGEANPERCASARIDAQAPFWVAYRRAALLHGLGLPGLASAELEVAGRKAGGDVLEERALHQAVPSERAGVLPMVWVMSS
jgi:hypothetical protein